MLKIHFFPDGPHPSTLGSRSLNPSQAVFFVRLFIKKKTRMHVLKPIEIGQTQASWFSPASVCQADPRPRPRWSLPSLSSPSGSCRACTTSPSWLLWSQRPGVGNGDRGLPCKLAGPEAKPKLCWARSAFQGAALVRRWVGGDLDQTHYQFRMMFQ